MPILVISVITKALCLLAVYISLYHLRMNLVSVAWILATTMAVQSFSVYMYMRWTGIAEQWWGSITPSPSPTNAASSIDSQDLPSASPHPDAAPGVFSLRGLYEYCVLAIPACMAICLEFWLFDLLGGLAGVLPNASRELAVHYLLFTSTLASYMIFSGLSVSVSVLVGQKLGCAGQSANAKRSAIVGTSACLCVSGLLMLVIALFHDTLARALTNQAELLERFTECVPVLICYQAVDGLNTCSTQLLRTLGVQKYGVLLHFICYYVIGLSSSCLLAFPCHLGVMGLWIGLCIGVGLNAAIATTWLWLYADWEEQSQNSQSRAVALCGALGDTPAAFHSTSDAYAGSELPEPHVDERTSLFSMQSHGAHVDHHGN
jgi:hypothetical protein